MEDIAQWASDTFTRLRAKQHLHRREIKKLQKARVAEHQIEALYPFDTADYIHGIELSLMRKYRLQGYHDALENVNIPFVLSAYLPQELRLELMEYEMFGMHAALSSGTPSPLAQERVGQHSDALRLFITANKDLAHAVETMIQLPHWLHVVRNYPFSNLPWADAAKESFRREVRGSTQADIEAYVDFC